MASKAGLVASGVAAPEFTLPAAPDTTLSLASLRGKPVILAFYPADWSPVCGDQMALYNEILPSFRNSAPAFWGSPSMASGVIARSRPLDA